MIGKLVLVWSKSILFVLDNGIFVWGELNESSFGWGEMDDIGVLIIGWGNMFVNVFNVMKFNFKFM